MKEIRKRVLKGKIQTCRTCGEPLENGELQSYDHDGGYDLKGFGQPQWVYLECSKCRYQLSIWKLRIDLSDLEKSQVGNILGSGIGMTVASLGGDNTGTNDSTASFATASGSSSAYATRAATASVTSAHGGGSGRR